VGVVREEILLYLYFDAGCMRDAAVIHGIMDSEIPDGIGQRLTDSHCPYTCVEDISPLHSLLSLLFDCTL
jgi:hypothetical protein